MNPERPAMAARRGQLLLATHEHCLCLGHIATHSTTWGKQCCGHHLHIPGCGILGWQNGTQGADHNRINSTINSQLI